MTDTKKAILLLSGGLDSAAHLALALDKKYELQAVFFDYGQKASVREKNSAQSLCQYYQVPLQIMELPFFKYLSQGALLNPEQEIPTHERSESSALQVWIPNRNGIFISIAAALAEKNSFSHVLAGFNKEEAETFPDNSIDFVEKTNSSLLYSTRNGVQVESLTLNWNKKEIVQNLKKLKKEFPWNMIWSCYTGEAKPCGICESCLRFKTATEENHDL